LTDEDVGREEQGLDKVARIIRARSEAGELTAREEILKELVAEITPATDAPCGAVPLEAVISAALESHRDLQELAHDGRSFYYSALFMSEPYAGILLRKQGDPLSLMAGIVRENSDVYPRPIPLHSFKHAPFELSHEEIESCIERMALRDEFNDIRQTTTSSQNIFLYSTLYLEPDHATMLAEWLDVGQFENP
jgi:hypothetical protein